MESLKGFNIRNAEDEDNSKQMVINDTVHGHIGISTILNLCSQIMTHCK
jgi:hypothetical protein